MNFLNACYVGCLASSVLLLQSGCTSSVQSLAIEKKAPAIVGDDGVHSFSLNSLAGEPISLSKYRGKLLLLVNTASKCGLTKQYEQLQQLHERYGDQGLVVIGIPANNFGKQEPGTNEQIAVFCQQNYGVTFPMMAKIDVKGKGIHPLYKYLINSSQPAKQVSWNFEKFLIAADGDVIGRFSPRVKPLDKQILTAIEQHLPGRKK